ncbi:TonB-dependent receptor [Halioxenophilus sp. WMMB6]|uniref:TonB-dependent receptor n=1 Tax=Halioxenophilus sp. WMMB6 TaxID=3073815 RepID=UPI00295F0CCB|nr:TonB-dependent receptor [Halioxenophilus sp. WMMB6]
MSDSGIKIQALVGAIGIALCAQNALSQSLEEVVVTAQKRAQDMQDVPIAVTAMNAEMLKEAGITNVNDVAVRTPGFSMGEFNPTQPQLYIRGIGSNGDGAANGEQSVAMFVDGIYVPRSAGTGLELFDIQTIEVLRGPQGTLWGKNAIGGAINITTKKPSQEFEAGVEVTAGNLGLKQVRGMVNGPLMGEVAGKVSFNSKQRDSYISSVYNPDAEFGEVDSQSLRGQLSFLASENLEFLLTANYGEDERTGAGSMTDGGMTSMVVDAAVADGFVPRADFHENYSNFSGSTTSDNKGVSLQADWQLENFDVTSLTSYTENSASFFFNPFGIAPELFSNYGPLATNVLGPLGGVDLISTMTEESSLMSQELRLSGGNDNFTWQTGVYYSVEDVVRDEGAIANAPAFFIASLGIGGALAYSPNQSSTVQDNVTTSIAAFGEMTFMLSDKLDLILGARFTEETKEYENYATLTALASTAPVIENYLEDDNTWRSPTYKAVVTYRFDDDIMSYLSIASGFKSGGFDYIGATETKPLVPFDEETAINYELGVKSVLLDKTLRLNAALFRTDYQDLQVLQQFPCDECGAFPPLITKNAGEAVSQGLELEMTYLVGEHLSFGGSYAYLDATYKELGGDLSIYEGNVLRNAPKNAYTANVGYETELKGGYLKARLEYIHKEKAHQSLENYEEAAIPEYRLFNGRIAYTSSNEAWELALWGKNLLDEEYYIHNFNSPSFGSTHIAATPRSYGLSLTWKKL